MSPALGWPGFGEKPVVGAANLAAYGIGVAIRVGWATVQSRCQARLRGRASTWSMR